MSIRWLAFRKHSGLPVSRQQQVQAEVADVVSHQVFLERTFNPSARSALPSPQRAKAPEDAEKIAEGLRARWRLQEAVIESVVQTIEDRGGIVVCLERAVPKFDGLSGWADDSFPVLVCTGETSLDRRRYNLAHELGHLVLDCEGISAKEEEVLAHRLAAAFLVPAVVARRELGTSRRSISMNELMLLKEKYGLSMQGWARRAFDLGIIGEGTYKRLCIDFSRRGWRVREPVQFACNEEPMRLRLLTLRAVSEGMISPTRAEELCPGCIDEIPVAQGRRLRPSEIRRLPVAQRERLLQEAAAAAAPEYQPGSPLRDFEAFGESDLLT